MFSLNQHRRDKMHAFESKGINRHMPLNHIGILGYSLPFLGALYIVILYFKPILIFLSVSEIIIANLNIIVVSVMLIIILMKYLKHVINAFGKHILFLFISVAVVILSFIFGIMEANISNLSRSIYELSSTWVVYLIFALIASRHRYCKLILWTLVICAILNSLVGIWGAFTGDILFNTTSDVVGPGSFGYDEVSGRSGGIKGENYVGVWTVAALAMGLWYLFERKYILTSMSLVLISAAAIMTSLSRTSLLCGIISFVVMFLYRMKNRRSYKIVILILSAITLYYMASYVYEHQSQYFTAFASKHQSARWNIEAFWHDNRITLWTEYFEDVLKRPIIGMGPGYISKKVSLGWFVTHNSFLDVTVEFGLVGLALYVIPYFLTLRRSIISLKKRQSDHLQNIFVATFWGMATAVLFLSNPFNKIMWIVAGLIEGRSRFSQVSTTIAKNVKDHTNGKF